LAILDNILTVGESAGAESKLAGLTIIWKTSLKEWKGGVRNLTAADFAETLQGNMSTARSA
jgi:hypothetical protein